jgi:hypothetical protein
MADFRRGHRERPVDTYPLSYLLRIRNGSICSTAIVAGKDRGVGAQGMLRRANVIWPVVCIIPCAPDQ